MPRTLPRLLTPFRVQRPDADSVAAGMSIAKGAVADGCAVGAVPGAEPAYPASVTATVAASCVATGALAERVVAPVRGGCASGLA